MSHVSGRFIDNFLRARELSTASLTDLKKLFCAAGNFVRDSRTLQTMRILPRITGGAVLILALHGIHLIHHFYGVMPHDSALFWLGMMAVVCVEALSFVGGYLLVTLRR
jgi:hypothetical protein